MSDSLVVGAGNRLRVRTTDGWTSVRAADITTVTTMKSGAVVVACGTSLIRVAEGVTVKDIDDAIARMQPSELLR